MKTAKRPCHLQTLERIVEQGLERNHLKLISLKVNCVLFKKRLVILLQHHLPKYSSPETIFTLVREIIVRQELTEVDLVLIYLGLYTQNPYASDIFKLEEITAKFLGNRTRKKKESKYLKPLFWGTGMMIFAASCLGVYTLSRPCVFGNCPEIFQAQQFASQSEKIIDSYPSKNEIILARENLENSLQLLSSIPPWSSYHHEANDLAEVYQGRLFFLAPIVIAMNNAYEGARLAKNTPLTVNQWQEIEQLWQGAIANLVLLSPEDKFYPLAQVKIPLYQRNLKEVQRRLSLEKQAQKNLESAQETAKITEMRQAIAQSLFDWRLVNNNWTTVFERLQNISQETTAYEQAQQLLKAYTPKYTVAKQEKSKEELALKLYDRALAKAKLAKQSQRQNQWSQAITYWNYALSLVKKIPQNTSLSAQTEKLLSNYNQSINYSQKQLKIAIKAQTVRQKLTGICQGEERICTSTVNNSLIKIHLNPSYMRKLMQIAIFQQSQTQMMEHIASLEKAFKTISNQAGIPLEVYHADGSLLFSYMPENPENQ